MHLPRAMVVAMVAPSYRLGLNARLPVAAQRRITEAAARPIRPPRGTQISMTSLGGRPCERTAAGDGSSAIVYLHGGGYVLGAARMYRSLCGHLAAASGATVWNLDYRLAPEHVFPAALDDAVAAVHQLIDRDGIPPERIALAGDSAGGGLAVAAARRLTDEGLRPAALALLSPWTDPTDTDSPPRDFVLTASWGHAWAQLYRGDAAADDPGYAPMYANLRGLPPMLLHIGRQELLHAQAMRFAARASAAGADIEVVEHEVLWHSAHILAGMLREATDAVADAGAWLGTRLCAPSLASSPLD